MKHSGYGILYFLGLILGTICINMWFDVTELPYCSSLKWSWNGYGCLLLRRTTELLILFFILNLLPKGWDTRGIIFAAGGIIGGLTSIRACTGTMLHTFLYGGMVLLLLIGYLSSVFLTLTFESKCEMPAAASTVRKWMYRLCIVTIVLLTCAAELKFLKFF